MTAPLAGIEALLVDLDGVLYVDDEPVTGAREAVVRLRAAGLVAALHDEHDLAFARTDTGQA